MTMYIVKGAACSDVPTENHHPTLQLSSALQSFSLNCFGF